MAKSRAPAEHRVKSWPMLYLAALRGEKKHDIRDATKRDYQIGDLLVLEEFDPAKGKYTGRWARYRITYITDRSTPCALSSVVLEPGYCILSIERASR